MTCVCVYYWTAATARVIVIIRFERVFYMTYTFLGCLVWIPSAETKYTVRKAQHARWARL